MAKIGIFVGTAGGTSRKISDALAEAFGVDEDDVIDMEEDFDELEQLEEYDILFLGSSTWGQGDLHHAWVDPMFEFDNEEMNMGGKKVAFFGAGDCVKHGEHFVSALGKLHNSFVKAGAEPFGAVSKEGYSYEFSLAEINGKLCGLGIDEHNESDKTEARISNWIEQVKSELKL